MNRSDRNDSPPATSGRTAAQRPGAWFAALSPPVQGAFLMTTAAFGFSVMNVLIRMVADAGIPAAEIAFFRNLFALAVMLPWLMRSGRAGLRTERLGLHGLRAVMGLAAMLAWFYSLAYLPVAEAVALNFTVPLFATIGAALILGEIVRIRRWSATAIGFLGVLVIVRPGFGELTWATGLPVLAAGLMALSILIVKTLSATERPTAIVFYMNLLLTPLSLVPAVFVWQTPGWRELLILAAIGGLAVGAHMCLTRAYQQSDASAIVPFDYARLPFAAVLAFLLFGEFPDLWTWVGAAVIAGSAIYIARRESQVLRERRASGLAGRAPEGQS